MHFLDLFAEQLLEKRKKQKVTQRALAEKLNMCTRTIMDVEKCRSNSRFETVALIAKEMDISLDGVVFQDHTPQEVPKCVPKCVSDFFAGKSETESQKYIDLCLSVDNLKKAK